MILKYYDYALNENKSNKYDWNALIKNNKISKQELQIINIGIFLAKLDLIGITNNIEKSNILAQIKHECDYIPVEENKYSYSVDWLFRTFGSGNKRGNTVRFKTLKDAQHAFSSGDEYLFNILYSDNKGLGNIKPDDGYRYRGRGFIQLTGRENYKIIGDNLGIDLINNVDLVLNPNYAFDISIEYLNVKLNGLNRLNNIDYVCKSIGYAGGGGETLRRKQTASKLQQYIINNKLKPVNDIKDAIDYLYNINNSDDGIMKLFKPSNTNIAPKDNTNVYLNIQL